MVRQSANRNKLDDTISLNLKQASQTQCWNKSNTDSLARKRRGMILGDWEKCLSGGHVMSLLSEDHGSSAVADMGIACILHHYEHIVSLKIQT